MNFEAVLFVVCTYIFGFLILKLMFQKEKIDEMEMIELKNRVKDYYLEREDEWYANFFKQTPQQILTSKTVLKKLGHYIGDEDPVLNQDLRNAVLSWAKSEDPSATDPDRFERYIAALWLEKVPGAKDNLNGFIHNEDAAIRRFGTKDWQKYKKYRNSL